MPPSRKGRSGGFSPYAMMGMGGRSSKPAPAPKTFKKVTAEFNGDIKNLPEGWDQTKLDAPKVDTLKFGQDFSINDAVLESLIAWPALCTRLTTFLAGDNETGSGVHVSKEAFVRFIKMCPEMRLMRLESHTSLGQDALLAILESCPKIEALHISGHDRSHGRIDDKALTAVAAACDANPSFGVKLRDLTLHDQSVYEKGVKKLQKARRLVIVRTGDTLRQHAYSRDAEYYAYRGGKMVFGAVETSKYQWW
ncbi:uncharacterized protein ARMOST_19662 [Armillaria ostoyae]|uniref:Uncharacterized protein n=1 Tax=Armillaria ostoyae TaxID=47428 RepID=A0A284S578_ARMOS|nr:uncharacterized protein ARMOST_19662 [Armillaria ostoyae]